MALIALEIDDNVIHVAASRAGSRRVQIQHLCSIAVEGSDEEVAKQLRDHLNKLGLGRSDAIVVISRGDSEIRLLDVPPAPNRELPEIVRFVARNEFASLNDNWLLDFVRLTGDESTTGQVLAAGLSPEKSQQLRKIVEAAGLRLKHVALRPFAAVGLLRDRLNDDAVRMLIDPNGDQTDLSIVIGQHMVATRTVRISTGQGDHLENLIPEIRRTIASSSRALGGKSVNQFIVFGDSDFNTTMGERLRSRLDVDVAFVDPIKLPIVGSQVKVDDHGTRYVALMGALVQEVSGERHPIDFLNPRRPQVRQSNYTKWAIYGGAAAALALIAVGFAWWTLNQQRDRIATLEGQLLELEDRNSGKLGMGVDEKLEQVEKIDEWVLNRIDWQQQLLTYSNLALTADDAIVDSFTGEAPSARVDGKISVVTRSADFRTEGQLIESLETQYEVVQTRSNDADDDPEYPIESTLNLPLVSPDDSRLEAINTEAEAEFKRNVEQRRKEATSGSDESTESSDDAVAASAAGESASGADSSGESDESDADPSNLPRP